MQTMLCEDGTVRAVIHFAVWDGLAYRLACTKEEAEPKGDGYPLHKTDDPRATTCGMCWQTTAFKEALVKAPLFPGRDFFRGIRRANG